MNFNKVLLTSMDAKGFRALTLMGFRNIRDMKEVVASVVAELVMVLAIFYRELRCEPIPHTEKVSELFESFDQNTAFDLIKTLLEDVLDFRYKRAISLLTTEQKRWLNCCLDAFSYVPYETSGIQRSPMLRNMLVFLSSFVERMKEHFSENNNRALEETIRDVEKSIDPTRRQTVDEFVVGKMRKLAEHIRDVYWQYGCPTIDHYTKIAMDEIFKDLDLSRLC